MSSASFTINQGRLDLIEEYFNLKSQSQLHCGDDFTFTFTYVDFDEDPIDISGATITMTIKYAIDDSEGNALVQVSGTVTDGPNGVFTITLDETDVAGPERIRAYYDVQSTISNVTSTLIYGVIEFLPNITQTTP